MLPGQAWRKPSMHSMLVSLPAPLGPVILDFAVVTSKDTSATAALRHIFAHSGT